MNYNAALALEVNTNLSWLPTERISEYCECKYSYFIYSVMTI